MINSSDNIRNQKNILIGYIILIFISSYVQINLGSIIATGFVVALDVVVMGVFLVLQAKKYSVPFIVGITAFVSPMSRFILSIYTYSSIETGISIVFPDATFFLIYGVIYGISCSIVNLMRDSYLRYWLIIFVSDICGNSAENLLRNEIFGSTMEFSQALMQFVTISFVRSTLVVFLVFAIRAIVEYNSRLDKWNRMLEIYDDMTTLSEELLVIRKNADEVESVMAEAYELNRKLSQDFYPRDVSSKAHEIAVRMHEIKGEYQNMLSVLEKLMGKREIKRSFRFSYIAEIVSQNVEAWLHQRGFTTRIEARIEEDISISDTYKMISIIRNLVTNSAEAIDSEPGGEIIIYSRRSPESSEIIEIGVRDNGPGIDEDSREDIFVSGYSSKFDYETGYIQRGLGLYLVKTYVEDDWGGSITVDSDGMTYTDIRMKINRVQIEG